MFDFSCKSYCLSSFLRLCLCVFLCWIRQSMKVAINVNHPTVSHLEVSLRYESAIAWLARQKGGITPNFVGTIFSDYGETPIPMGLDAIAQTPFQGEYSLDPDRCVLDLAR